MPASSYKDTLHLPKTAFAMKANLAQREPGFLQHWQATDLYQKIRAARAGCEAFILHDGPPYANGDLHVGHAVNKVLKDMIVKSKTLSGFDAPYVPGWDCHGLPIELQVEKKVGKPGKKVDANTFRQKCRQYAQTQVNRQRESFERLGVLGDWSNPYLTMDTHYEANIIRTMKRIVANGHLKKGFKPVHWCCDCGSSLAEAEVEYQDKTSTAIDVLFSVVDRAAMANCFGLAEFPSDVDIIIWTTTPWTLPANLAVSVGPDIDYALVRCQTSIGEQHVIVANALLADVMQRAEVMDYSLIATVKGDVLAGLSLQHPFLAREVPVLCGEHVTTDSGTGLVHTAPAHGVDDYHICQQHGIDVINPVNAHGVFVADTPVVAGLFYAKANPVVIDALLERQRLWHQAHVQHSYPHCWRHKTPLIFRATQQWFIAMEQSGLRDAALAAVKTVEWIPQWGEVRIEKMLAGRPDWCVSRQRTWGTPLPLFVHQETGELHSDALALMDQVADLVEQGGIEAWFETYPAHFLGAAASEYEVVRDTLDVWFDSGVSYAAVLQDREQLRFPADLYLEGSDQHRGWFHTSLLASLADQAQAPYRQVLTHGFAVDEKGHKMSKSLGNTILPQEITKTLGADVLRLWVASTDYRAEMAISQQILTRVSDVYRRIRNTARFLLANLHDFIPAEHEVASADLLPLDQWVMTRAAEVQTALQQAYDTYRFHNVTQSLHDFCALDLGSFYLDVIKDRQYTCQANSLIRRSAQTAMYHVVSALARWMAPVLSFTAEEIWQCLPEAPREESVFLSHWYTELSVDMEQQAISADDWQRLLTLRNAVNKHIETARSEGLIGSGLQAEVIFSIDETWLPLLEKLGEELRFILITSTVTLKSLAATAVDLPGVSIEVQASAHPKCARCWHHRADVGQHAEADDLCGRCVENVFGEGEVRQYA